jgi:alkanesulfonate monooxygenase SsuD/methylene tetrahydromethanopterin reductase-like flavin-dependent oxidoreductase (luciferase family)
VYPRAEQEPLPVWIAVGGTPESVARAGRLGLPLALAIIGGDPRRFRPLVDLYRRSLAEHGHDPDATPLAVHAHGLVGEEDDEIAELVWPAYSAGMNRIGRERGWPPLTRDQYDWMRGPDGNLVMGSPETVSAKIDRWRDMLDLDRFMLHTVGALPHDRVLRSIELFGTKVAGELR